MVFRQLLFEVFRKCLLAKFTFRLNFSNFGIFKIFYHALPQPGYQRIRLLFEKKVNGVNAL